MAVASAADSAGPALSCGITRRVAWKYAVLALAAFAMGAGCGRDRGVRTYLDETYPDKLSDWRIFTSGGPKPALNAGVYGYDVRTPLFSDYADKSRAMWIPPGKRISVSADGRIEFPVGTILLKNFSFPEGGKERLIETRLEVHRPNGWVAVPYVWNREQTDAALAVSGDFTTVRHDGQSFEYTVPGVNQCRSCHDQAGDTVPLGPKVRNLDAATLRRLGVAAPAPAVDTVDHRARMYLDVNCSHCHNPVGSAMAIPLDLRYEQTDPAKWGVNAAQTKPLDGAPKRAIIAPGHPEISALVRRMQSTQEKVGMPTLGHALVHREGVELVSAWVRGLGSHGGLGK